jgi:hypothetical protein
MARGLSISEVETTRRSAEENTMNRKQIAVLIAFLSQDAYVIYLYGYVGFFRMLLANPAGVAAAVDMSIALVLIAIWMSEDAQQRKISALPYLLVTVALGSAGPLLYLVRRFADRPDENPVLAAGALHN